MSVVALAALLIVAVDYSRAVAVAGDTGH